MSTLIALPPPVLNARASTGSATLQKRLEEAARIIKQAYIEVPNHELVIPKLLQYGVKELPQHCFLTPGIPVQVMLGKPLKGLAALLEKFGEMLFTIEFKYDGERAQVRTIIRSSINGNEWNCHAMNRFIYYPMVPCEFTVVTLRTIPRNILISFVGCPNPMMVQRSLPSSLMLKWWHGIPKPKISYPSNNYQHENEKVTVEVWMGLMTLDMWCSDAKETDDQVQVALYAFDLIYINGRSLLQEPLQTRREILRASFHEVPGQFHFAQYKDTSDPTEIEAFMKLAIQSSCEGLMVKALTQEANYVPAKRNWLKVP